MSGKTVLRLLGLSAFLGLSLLALLASGTADDVDSCLDSGGCFNYSTQECEYEDQARCSGSAGVVDTEGMGAWRLSATGRVVGALACAAWVVGVIAVVRHDLNTRAGMRGGRIARSEEHHA